MAQLLAEQDALFLVDHIDTVASNRDRFRCTKTIPRFREIQIICAPEHPVMRNRLVVDRSPTREREEAAEEEAESSSANLI